MNSEVDRIMNIMNKLFLPFSVTWILNGYIAEQTLFLALSPTHYPTYFNDHAHRCKQQGLAPRLIISMIVVTSKELMNAKSKTTSKDATNDSE